MMYIGTDGVFVKGMSRNTKRNFGSLIFTEFVTMLLLEEFLEDMPWYKGIVIKII